MNKWVHQSANISRFTLYFPDNREQEFRDYYFTSLLSTTRFAFVLLTILYGVFGYIDISSAGEFLDLFLIIRFFIVMPFFLLTLALSYNANFYKFWQQLIFFTYITASFGIITMIVLLPEESFYSNGMMLIFLAGSVFVGLRFYLGALAGIISISVYNISAVIWGVSSTIIITNNFFFFGALIIGMFASYYNESFNRQNFDLNIQLAKKNLEIKNTNINLEQQVSKRTELLKDRNKELYDEVEQRKNIEKELITAKEAAEQSDKLKSAFLANMSHEIRTPMNGIIGFSNLLIEAENDEERNDFINNITKSGDHLLNLINDIIDLSKIESGTLDIKLQSFNLNELTKEIYDLFIYNQYVVSNKLKLSYINGIDNDKAFITTDKTRLKQILINLVNNACKYTDKGSISYSYTIDNGKLFFEVIDTGIGIDLEQQKYIFDRFMQVTLNNMPVRESTGLGLAITKTYLQMMGGDISVSSKPNLGSNFSFYLPINVQYNI